MGTPLESGDLSHRTPKCYARELLESWHKIQRYLEEIRNLTPKKG